MENRPKVALVELATHNEVLVNHTKLLLTGEFEITIFSNEFNYSQIIWLQLPVNWVLQESEECNVRFAKRIQSQLNDFSLVIFTTIESNIRFFRNYDLSSPTALVVHKLNMFINPQKPFVFNENWKQRLKDSIKIIRYFLFGERSLFIAFVNSFDQLIFPSFAVQIYFIEQGWNKGMPPHSVIPFAVHESVTTTSAKADKVRITIPGVISSKSRDYGIVLEAFKDIRLHKQVKLTLLGKPSGPFGHKIVRQFKSLQRSNLEIQTYDSFVHQEYFDEILKQSDFLILPISRFMKVSIFKEINGFTCVSGNVNDMMRFAIPSLISDFYPLDKELKELTQPFNSATELRNLVESWVKENTYLEKKKNASALLSSHQLDKIAKDVKRDILKLMT